MFTLHTYSSQIAALQDPPPQMCASRTEVQQADGRKKMLSLPPRGTYLAQQFNSPPWHCPEMVKVGGHAPARQKFP